MLSTCEPYKNSKVYFFTFELEENEINALNNLFENGYVFELSRSENWAILSNSNFHWALWENEMIKPAGIFVNNRWEGFLYPNGVEEVENAGEIANDFIANLKEKIEEYL